MRGFAASRLRTVSPTRRRASLSGIVAEVAMMVLLATTLSGAIPPLGSPAIKSRRDAMQAGQGKRYPGVAMLLHWAIAAAVVAQWRIAETAEHAGTEEAGRAIMANHF